MSSFQNQQVHQQQSNQCSECKKKYEVSSQEEEERQSINERIIIPLKKDVLGERGRGNGQIEMMLKNLEMEIEQLKQMNLQKDKMIEDLKKQMEHKMTHFMLYGEINKQADEISRLRNEIGYGGRMKYGCKNGVGEEQIRQIFREESKRVIELSRNGKRGRHFSQIDLRQKYHSIHDKYSKLRNQLMNSSKQKTVVRPERAIYNHRLKQSGTPDATKQYFENETKIREVFNIKQAKNRILQLEQKLLRYQEELGWMNNFVMSFIRSIENIARKKYQEEIIMAEWGLKKKVKSCWRYMKHLFSFYYSESN